MTDKKKMARPDLSVLSDAELAARGASLAELDVALGHLYEAVRRHEAENKAIVRETRELGRCVSPLPFPPSHQNPMPVSSMLVWRLMVCLSLQDDEPCGGRYCR